MPSLKAIAAFTFGLLLSKFCVAQIGPPPPPPEPEPFLAVNNSGFIQNGLGGADNLVLFNVTLPDIKAPFEVEMLPNLAFSIVGDLSSGFDQDANGANDSVGTFSGLEWTNGTPGNTLIGCVLNDGVGNGEFYQIDADTAVATLIGNSPVVDGEQRHFSDLAFNPTDGLMYGLMNDLEFQKNGNVETGPNSLWVDTDGDLIPDTQLGERISTDPFCLATLATLASGLAFDALGRLYVYDNSEEEILAGGANSANLGANPCVGGFQENETGLMNLETEFGNGMTVVGPVIYLGSDVEVNDQRTTVVSIYRIPSPFDPPPEPPEVEFAARFPNEFFQTGLVPAVSIGDLVWADVDDDNSQPVFPDNVIVNSGIPTRDSLFEAFAVSDDLRYRIRSTRSPGPNPSLIDITLAFTVPDPANVTGIEFELESQANNPNLFQDISAFNWTTNEFVFLATRPISFNMDTELAPALNLPANIEDFVNAKNGSLQIRLRTTAGGPRLFYPLEVEYDLGVAVPD